MNAVVDNSSSLVSSNGHMNHDVFLSFRGPDTRKIFAGHLYRALQQKAIVTFIDSENLEKGAEIEVLLKAIEMSKLSVVVFSKNYASSTWCLKEIAKIMECMNSNKAQKVVPVFYDVEPAVIKHQTGSFKEALDHHVTKGRVRQEVLQTWRSALSKAASLSGWNSRDYSDDSKLVEDIATDIVKKMKPTWKYDVFLNSCKKDTAYKMFVSHLYAALKQRGISTFPADQKSNDLQQRDIDESGLSVVVICHDYPWDTQCLKELVQIMECMDRKKKPTVVIFYGGIESSDLIKRKGTFEKAFADHERQGRYTKEELQKWKSALTRAFKLPGFQTEDSEDHAKLIENICEQISRSLMDTKSKDKPFDMKKSNCI